ncbi:MAG: TolC family protein, partial [Pseudomonadota bacterium]
MRLVQRLAVSAALSAGLLAGTPAAFAETITGALQRAYSHNSTLNAQRAATRAADEQLPQALSGFRPTVSLTADAGFSRSRTQTFVDATPGSVGINGQGGLIQVPGRPGQSVTVRSGTNPYGVGVTIQQSLFSGFRVVNGVKAAKAAIQASRETLANVEQNTLLTAAQAYAAVVFNRDLVQLRRQNISFLSEQLRSSQARLDVGEGTRTDVAQSNGRLALGRAQLAAAQGDLASAEGVY